MACSQINIFTEISIRRWWPLEWDVKPWAFPKAKKIAFFMIKALCVLNRDVFHFHQAPCTQRQREREVSMIKQKNPVIHIELPSSVNKNTLEKAREALPIMENHCAFILPELRPTLFTQVLLPPNPRKQAKSKNSTVNYIKLPISALFITPSSSLIGAHHSVGSTRGLGYLK